MGNWIINRYIILPALVATCLNAQFTTVNVTMEDRLLKNDDRQVLLPLNNEIERFFINTTWDEDWGDLGIELNVQIIFQGTATKNGKETFLAQVLFSTKT